MGDNGCVELNGANLDLVVKVMNSDLLLSSDVILRDEVIELLSGVGGQQKEVASILMLAGYIGDLGYYANRMLGYYQSKRRGDSFRFSKDYLRNRYEEVLGVVPEQ